jgi:hypothetical protein
VVPWYHPQTEGVNVPNETPDKPEHGGGDRPNQFNIQIDREHYKVEQAQMTGAELRLVPPSAIPDARDLFEVVPGHPDRKIENHQSVEIRNGLRFFTAPGTINPGQA